jgi:hypothetical protein
MNGLWVQAFIIRMWRWNVLQFHQCVLHGGNGHYNSFGGILFGIFSL